MKFRILLAVVALSLCASDSFAGPILNRIRERRAGTSTDACGAAQQQQAAGATAGGQMTQQLAAQTCASATACAPQSAQAGPQTACQSAPQQQFARRGVFRR